MRALGAFALVTALAAGSCSRASAVRANGPAGLPSGEFVLREACVPSGPERCSNARDDNCNGLIDEGCGLHTGVVEFVIAWDVATADVDLLVTDPKGELVDVGHPSAAGLVKERDCPGKRNECGGKNVENVYQYKGEPKRGLYRVKILLDHVQDDDAPIEVTLGARVGPKTYAADVELRRAEDSRELRFVL